MPFHDDRISAGELNWKQVLRDFWKDFFAQIEDTKELRVTNVLDSLNEALGGNGPATKPCAAEVAVDVTCADVATTSASATTSPTAAVPADDAPFSPWPCDDAGVLSAEMR